MTTSEVLKRPPRTGTPPLRAAARRSFRPVVEVGLAAAVAVAAWLPFLRVPLSPDEGGFLLLARQWSPGSSLYGDYWVDRPPLLLWLYGLAGRLGEGTYSHGALTAPSVKLLGAAACAAAVVLAGVLAHLLAPGRPWPRRATLLAAVALLSTPLLGMPETNGEVLAVPLVLLGVVCLVASTRRPWGGRAIALTVAAGAAAVGAALVKQNVVDVFVFAVVLLVAARRQLRHRLLRIAAFAAGTLGLLAVVLAAAARQGTSPAGLWDAVVVFRLQASSVISGGASTATGQRAFHVLLAGLASGALVLLLVAAFAALRASRSGRPPLREQPEPPVPLHRALVWSAVAMAAWEVCGVALGGSYWFHYLTGLVPGALVLVALARPRRPGLTVLTAALSYVVLASAVVWGAHVARPAPVSDQARVGAYLRAHARPTDGVVVAFGHPDIVASSGLHSPYEYLWSLPVRVRDPQLRQLGEVLGSADAPRWVVVSGNGLDSWGLQPKQAQSVLRRHYVEGVTYGDWHVWRLRAGLTDR